MGITDQNFMREALALAKRAESDGEVPIGAVLVLDDEIIARGYNQPITFNDPTAHAEMMALREGGRVIDNYRLLNTTLYCTLEPCLMCAMALVHARVSRVVFAAFDPKQGACGSCYNTCQDPTLNHQLVVDSGVLADEATTLLKTFFKSRRK